MSLIQYKYYDGLGNDIYHGQIFIVIESFSVGLAEGGFGLNEYFVEWRSWPWVDDILVLEFITIKSNQCEIKERP